MMHERSNPVATAKQPLIDVRMEWMDAWQRLDVTRLEAIPGPEFTLSSAIE